MTLWEATLSLIGQGQASPTRYSREEFFVISPRSIDSKQKNDQFGRYFGNAYAFARGESEPILSKTTRDDSSECLL